MAAPFSVCIKEEKGSVIRFLWANDVPRAETYSRFSAQYGNSTLPQRSVYEWITMNKTGCTSVTDVRSEGSFTSTTEENTERVPAMILDNRRVAIDEVAYHIRISHGSAHGIQIVGYILQCSEMHKIFQQLCISPSLIIHSFIHSFTIHP
jgi:hypothetical protein